MINRALFENGLRGDRLLPVAELLHRVRNEYARIISLASTIAAKSSSNETKAALSDIITDLHSTAEIHSVLRPPLGDGPADLTEVFTRLCCAMSESPAFRRRGIKLELRVDHPVLIDAGRCWRASLVVAELINNSCRHAFASRSGCIFVAVGESHDRVFCNVSDDGSPAEIGGAGLGTRIVDALAAELDGLVERQFGKSGATVMLSFPKRAPIPVFQPNEYAAGQTALRTVAERDGAHIAPGSIVREIFASVPVEAVANHL
jgi:two-component sensor histidine kinase